MDNIDQDSTRIDAPIPDRDCTTEEDMFAMVSLQDILSDVADGFLRDGFMKIEAEWRGIACQPIPAS
jgi:hypothetical protein